MRVRIYQPTKSAMQSGKANVKRWVLEFEPEKDRFIEPLMGWTGSSDMKQEIKLRFDSKEEAIEYAQREGLDFQVVEPKTRGVIIRSYAENFTKPVLKGQG